MVKFIGLLLMMDASRPVKYMPPNSRQKSGLRREFFPVVRRNRCKVVAILCTSIGFWLTRRRKSVQLLVVRLFL